jgi:hypothetical protein
MAHASKSKWEDCKGRFVTFPIFVAQIMDPHLSRANVSESQRAAILAVGGRRLANIAGVMPVARRCPDVSWSRLTFPYVMERLICYAWEMGMKTQLALIVATCFSLAVAGCVPRQPQRVIETPPSNKVWARADGQRMAGNPTLTRQGQADLQQCRGLASINAQEAQYDLKILNGCMTSRGYVERDL